MELMTQRLVLRELREGDLAALVDLFGNSVFQRYESKAWSSAETQAKLLKFVADAQQQPRTDYRFAVTIRPGDALAGVVHLTEVNGEICEWEIGWGLHPAYWGRGYATEAAQELLRLAFDRLNIRRVVAFCHVDNHASARVMEKIGMQREGRLRETKWLNEQWWDELVYGILKREY